MKSPKTVPGAWYDQTPASYANGCRYGAERSDRSAERIAAEGKPWSEHEAERFRRQARRLRAMAILCDRATCATAGEVDFLGMTNPSQSREAEDAAVAQAEAMQP